MTRELIDTPLLRIEGVSVELTDRPIIRDVSISLASGRIVGLVGPNGAGKSTLIKTLCRLLKPSSGKVTLGGRDLQSYKRKELARLIGYLPQGHEMHWPLEVNQLVTLGRLPHMSPFAPVGQADNALIEQAMERTDVLAFRTRTADKLSMGERARVMLARTLASDPQILLVDEPVASLDPYHQIQVMELLKDLSQEGKLVVCVLHDLPLAARFCSELILLNEGEIVAHGDPGSVLTRDHLKSAYSVSALYGASEGEHYVLPWRRTVQNS